MNELLDELAGHLAACRKLWWGSKGTTCLENQWLVWVCPDKWEVPGQQRATARQVRQADYDAVSQTTHLTFWDGSRDLIEHGD